MKFNPKKNKDIKDEICQSKGNGDLVPFVGAGFSLNISGYPSFKHFINENISRRLCQYLKRPLTKKLDLWSVFNGNPNEAIEYFIYTVGKNGHQKRTDIFENGKIIFQKEVEREFDKVERTVIHGQESEWVQHFELVNKFPTIYTTNWDHSIELACQYNNIGYKKIYHTNKKLVEDEWNNSGSGILNNVIKFHGDFVDVDSMIACETDYFNRIAMPHNELDTELKPVLKDKNLMYLGYSLSDINIKYLINSTSNWRERFSLLHKSQYLISIENPNDVHEEKVKFFEEWLGIKTYFLFDGKTSPITEDQIKKEIRDFLSGL